MQTYIASKWDVISNEGLEIHLLTVDRISSIDHRTATPVIANKRGLTSPRNLESRREDRMMRGGPLSKGTKEAEGWIDAAVRKAAKAFIVER